MPKYLDPTSVRQMIAQAGGKPFVVKFRKADRTLRTMTALTGDPSKGDFIKGTLPQGHRQEEDARTLVCTVFSLDIFNELVGQGMSRIEAGRKAWRRIPLTRCTRVVQLEERKAT